VKFFVSWASNVAILVAAFIPASGRTRQSFLRGKTKKSQLVPRGGGNRRKGKKRARAQGARTEILNKKGGFPRKGATETKAAYKRGIAILEGGVGTQSIMEEPTPRHTQTKKSGIKRGK